MSVSRKESLVLRHASFYLAQAKQDLNAWAWFDQEWPQIAAAWGHVRSINSIAALSIRTEYALVFEKFLARRWLWSDTLAWAVELLSHLRAAQDHEMEVAILDLAGQAHVGLGNPTAAIEYHRTGVEMADRHGLSSAKGQHLHHLGLAYIQIEELDSAIHCLLRALEIAQAEQEWGHLGNRLNSLGMVYQQAGAYREAMDVLGRALFVAQELRDEGRQATVLGNLAETHLALGNLSQALDCLGQSRQNLISTRYSENLLQMPPLRC